MFETLYAFELENSFSSKSQNGRLKNLCLGKNRSKTGERAHVDTENRTMKSAQHEFWSYLYFGYWMYNCK